MEHTRRAAALLEGTGPSRARALALVSLASSLLERGHSQEAIQVGRQALAIANELGLDELRGRALNYIGCARFESGDWDGVADLEEAIAVTVEANSPYSAAAYGNLGAVLSVLGDPTRARRAFAKGREAAERFGLAGELRRFPAERVVDAYFQGRWDMARRGADQFIAESQAGSRHFLEIICLVVRGRIRLACGDRDGALQDAAAALEFAKQASEPQMLQPALAFHARVLLAAGRTNEAGAEASELLVMLAKERAVVAENDWSNDLAIVLQALGRGAELAQFPTRTTPTPWLQAATAFATGEFDRAAELYAQIGSLPDEAFARLCSAKQLVAAGHQAEAKAQVDRVLAFYRAAGASAYLRDGEVLLGVSA